jgi:CheY-like chemotaxis protein
MPYLDGLTLAWFFAQRFPAARVVLMSTDNTPDLREACEQSGALDFVHKENFREQFRAALERICSYTEGNILAQGSNH